jgi:hypothetical protein
VASAAIADAAVKQGGCRKQQAVDSLQSEDCQTIVQIVEVVGAVQLLKE